MTDQDFVSPASAREHSAICDARLATAQCKACCDTGRILHPNGPNGYKFTWCRCTDPVESSRSPYLPVVDLFDYYHPECYHCNDVGKLIDTTRPLQGDGVPHYVICECRINSIPQEATWISRWLQSFWCNHDQCDSFMTNLGMGKIWFCTKCHKILGSV